MTDEGRAPGAATSWSSTGFFDQPNLLDVPGEDLPKVTHYYREPYPYVRQKVAIIGAKNSAAKAALDCYRHGAEVTLIVRSAALSDKIKYWIKPDLENRIKEGSIRALLQHDGRGDPRDVDCCSRRPDGPREIDNDWVLAMTGYHPDYGFLEAPRPRVSQTTGIARRSSTRRRSRRPGRASTSRARSAAAIRPAAGSSRTAASTPGRSPGTSPAAATERVQFEEIHWKTEE